MNLETFSELLKRVSAIYEEDPINKLVDGTIYWAIKQFPTNNDEQGVLLKITLVNTHYRTRIFNINIVKMTQHIYRNSEEIDSKIAKGDLTVVDKIRQGHGIGKEEGNNLYVFATKYAHFHNQRAFPIFDNLVKDYLSLLNDKDELPFHDEFTKVSLVRSYSTFKSVLDTLISKLRLTALNYKQIDQGLWLLAKYRLENSLPEDIATKITAIIRFLPS